MKKNISHKGVRGRRIKIEPEKSEGFLQSEDNSFVKRGKVIAAGKDAVCKKGDTVIFTALGMDKIDIKDEVFYYVLDTDQFILEIL